MAERLDSPADLDDIVTLPRFELHDARMVLSTHVGTIEVAAPRAWLELLAEGDANGFSLRHLIKFAQGSWGDSQFSDFIADLASQRLVGLYPPASARPRVEFFEDSVGSASAIARADVRWPGNVRSEGWGRGGSRHTAARRALGEAVERHAFKNAAPSVLARGRDIASLEPQRAFIAHTAEQYREPDFPLRAYSALEERPWLRTECLATGSTRWIPAEAVLSAEALLPAHRAQRCAAATSSGFACAPSFVGAVEHGLWELVERDAFMRHWLAQRGGREIRRDTLPAPTLTAVRELEAVGCVVQVQRLTLAAAPVWFAFVQHTKLRFTCTGAAAGADPEDSVERAVAEAHGQALARVSTAETAVSEEVAPEFVATPADHARLYALPAYFRRADALRRCDGSESFAHARAVDGSGAPARRLLEQVGAVASVIDFSTTSLAFDGDGRRLHTVRVVVPSLVPMTFGARLLPLAFGPAEAGAEFPHPFA